MDEVIKTLNDVLNTLNAVEVKGHRNLNFMLGSMNALDGAIRRLMEENDNEAENQPERHLPDQMG